MISLGREPQDSNPKIIISRGAATDMLRQHLRLTPQTQSAAPPGL